jgi:ribosomal-protein-alanine N-acetyltransferase
VVHTRLAVREDIETLFALDQTCFRPGIAYSKGELQYFLVHPRSIPIVAEDETGIAGFAIVEIATENGRRSGHIVTIDVDESRRRQGVGRALMEALLDRCREARVASVRLEVAVDNDGAIAFYRRLGFEDKGRIAGFYMGKLDALRMVLDLPSGHTSTAAS